MVEYPCGCKFYYDHKTQHLVKEYCEEHNPKNRIFTLADIGRVKENFVKLILGGENRNEAI